MVDTPASIKYPPLTVNKKNGKERFFLNGEELGWALVEFWQWYCSDLTNNVIRGTLAEYIVARALGVEDLVRVEWDAVDLRTKQGFTIEVKSASYIQTWAQAVLSNISFDIAPKFAFDADTNSYSRQRRRWSDAYVFCLFGEKEKARANPLDLNQWFFYILPTHVLDALSPSQKTISLGRLKKLDPVETGFVGLADAVAKAAKMKKNSRNK